MSYEPKTTTDRDIIQKWAEERNGKPARIAKSDMEQEPDQAGYLRFDFGRKFREYAPLLDKEQISWDEFFEIFEDENLLFLYQDETEEGEKSEFHKFVKRS